jgi:cell division protein ZipA
MSELRWILLLIGIAVIGYIYWRARRDQKRATRRQQARVEPILRSPDQQQIGLVEPRREPMLGDLSPDPVEVRRPAEPRAAPAPAQPRRNEEHVAPARPAPAQPTTSSAPQTEPARRKIVALRIARRGGEHLDVPVLFDVLRDEGLAFGEYRIFHRYAEPAAPGDQRAPIFSVASMVEPGELDPQRAEAIDLPGVTLFMVLPGPRAGLSALTEMLGSARRIATAVGGELLDQNGSTMTRQTADHLRDEVIEFERTHRSQQQPSASGR